MRAPDAAPIAATKPAAAPILELTLAPERLDLGLLPIAIKRFPFLISKSDETFARHGKTYPHQVNYLSRRHAHIFLKAGQAFIEDLGSTNGTFLGEQRLGEDAVALREDDRLAFGGHHFVYRVHLHPKAPGDTAMSGLAPGPRGTPAEAEKTTFVAAADSFLNLFCVDRARAPEGEINPKTEPPPIASGKESGRKRSRGAILLSELKQALAGGETLISRRTRWAGGILAAFLGLTALVIHLRGAPERELQALLADGQYAQAARAAEQFLERHPDNIEIRALGTEALLKAHAPAWLALLKAREFVPAATALAGMKELAAHNADLQPLLGELEWLGSLERFVGGRGGVEAPIRIYGDEEKIKAFLSRWGEDPLGHQRALERISSYVPEFKDFYAEVLSHLRKLQSDDAVYLAAIERLKTAIATELNRDRPEALEAILNDYAEKYPRLGGLDGVREDLRQYREIRDAARSGNTERQAALLAAARFATPPFQARSRALAAASTRPPSGLPPAAPPGPQSRP